VNEESSAFLKKSASAGAAQKTFAILRTVEKPVKLVAHRRRRQGVDGRIKPGHDVWGCRFLQRTPDNFGQGRFNQHGPNESKVFCALFFKKALLSFASREQAFAEILGVTSVRRTARGKPVIDAPAGMSVSYSGDLCLLAVNGAGDVGVDMEVVREDLDFMGIAKACFAPAEILLLEALRGRRRVENFFALWTGKEAVLKFLGQGIAGGMAWPCLADLQLGGRAVVDGIEVAVSRRRFGGREIVTAVAVGACLSG
jgi:hypothetical protein